MQKAGSPLSKKTPLPAGPHEGFNLPETVGCSAGELDADYSVRAACIEKPRASAAGLPASESEGVSFAGAHPPSDLWRPFHPARLTPIPDLDARGLLPPGVHVADLEQLASAFGSTPYRRRLLQDLAKWLGDLPAGVVDAVLIAGSFLSNKPSPDDIDVAVIFDKEAGADQAAMLKADARRIWRAHRIDVFANAGQFFQFVGEKGAERHGCRPTALRGVVSLAPWHRDTQQIRDLSQLAKWARLST